VNKFEFVEKMLGQMTLAQKVGQMTQAERMAITPEQLKQFHIGSVLSGGGSAPEGNRPIDWVNMNDAYWAASMEADDDHLPIPLLYGVDAIHGNNNVLGATIFPHNIGLGATREPELLRRIAQVTAKEILATGVEWTFAPTLAVAQDSHWGRTYESYSSDTSVASSYAGPFVQGLQGDLGDDAVIACVKHWVGDGGTLHGIDQGETTLPLRELEKVHMAPYLPALKENVLTVMVSFNSWNSDKCHGHYQLVTEVLKQQLGFEGFVISDWDGIDYLDDSYAEAVALSVNAGVDLFMVSEQWQEFIRHLIEHVESGRVSMARIDDAVRRILNVKFRYRLFDKPRPSNRKWSNHKSFGSVEHRDVAREAVRKSLVLMKNDSGLLPLDKTSKVFVAGRLANDPGAQCGGFTIAWQGQTGPDSVQGATSIWQAIKGVSPAAQLSKVSDGSDASAEKHDVAIVVIGENPYAEGMGDIRPDDNVIVEAGSQIKGALKVLAPYGRSLQLEKLHPEDLNVLKNISACGVPVVVVLISGRPLLIDAERSIADAFVAAWLPGSEGAGVSDVLFGDYPFTGTLGFEWPSVESPGLALGFGLA
jgi:beta-glucosidase